ncbi:MAG: GNAT family N-acetyltransferase, partial [Bacteroidales bacterium]|nr:GNAT family N-acetyltransferase [Bacteroidales bacterium]
PNEPLMGYWVGKPYRNKGICTEALNLMIKHIRAVSEYKSLISSQVVDNPASGRVMQKCGFVPTGETCVDSDLSGMEKPMAVLRLEFS